MAPWLASLGLGFLLLILLLLQLDLERDLLVKITVLRNATQEGAVCLDGSPPAYHLHRGTGSGIRNWLLFLEGGGWCLDHASCTRRSRTALGSSRFMKRKASFVGILSNSPVQNPDFYNWNKVLLRYCDGGSFAGNVEDRDNAERASGALMYRGQRIWRAIIKDLMHQGMNQTDKALLSGRSAGGLATILNCNDFQRLLLPGAQAKCLSDAGFFLDVEDIAGNFSFRSVFRKVVDLQNVRSVLPKSCVTTLDSQCLFPQYVIPYLTVPLFVVNAAYDSWQVQNVLVPPAADPSSKWRSCKQHLAHCSASQMRVLQDFREKLLRSLQSACRDDADWGTFVVSCLVHSQINTKHWTRTLVANTTIQEAVGNWYFERSPVKIIDYSYPYNPSCSSH